MKIHPETAEIWVGDRQTDRQTDRRTRRQTAPQTNSLHFVTLRSLRSLRFTRFASDNFNLPVEGDGTSDSEFRKRNGKCRRKKISLGANLGLYRVCLCVCVCVHVDISATSDPIFKNFFLFDR